MSDVEVQSTVGLAPAPPAVYDDGALRVTWQGDDRFDVKIRDHMVTVDQPAAVGGADGGPTPTELFVGSLASCAAFYARRYLWRHDIDARGFEVRATYRMGTRPARVAAVDMEIHLAADLSEKRRAGLLAQAAHCTVHNTMTRTPDLAITLVPSSERSGQS